MGKFRYAAALLLLTTMLTGNSASAAMLKVISQDVIPDTCFKGSREDVVSMVDQAVELVSKIGPRDAFRQFMLPEGGFLNGDLYVFVLNPAGTILANGASPSSVGNNALLAYDSQGHYFVKSMLRKALSEGQGWVDYEWISPCTGKMAQKSSYCKRIDQFVVCAGLYNPIGASLRAYPNLLTFR